MLIAILEYEDGTTEEVEILTDPEGTVICQD
jgi:hypothetical protein